MRAISGSMNDLVDPESIRILILYSGKIMYDNSLELVVLKDMVCGIKLVGLFGLCPENFVRYLRHLLSFQSHCPD